MASHIANVCQFLFSISKKKEKLPNRQITLHFLYYATKKICHKIASARTHIFIKLKYISSPSLFHRKKIKHFNQIISLNIIRIQYLNTPNVYMFHLCGINLILLSLKVCNSIQKDMCVFVNSIKNMFARRH